MAACGTQIQKVEQVAAVQQLQVSLTEAVRIDGFWTDESYPLCLQAEMDARIAEIQQQLRERDAEINRLQTEIRVRT